MIQERTNHAAACGAAYVTAVVSPRNATSLSTLHGLGHATVGIHHDEDGENFLLLRPADGCFANPRQGAITVFLGDIARNLELVRGNSLVGIPVFCDDNRAYSYVESSDVFPANAAASVTSRTR